MNQYEKYVRGSIFLEEKTMNQECVNKFWILVNEAASKPNPPFSQELIDEAKKKCQNRLNPNVPKFIPRNTSVHIDSPNIQQAENDYHMCIICYTNHLKTYNCQTDMQNGFTSSDEENLTPSESVQLLEGQEVNQMGPAHQATQECYNPYNTYYQPYFEDFYGETDMITGYSSSDEENLTPIKFAHLMEQQEVIEGCYNPYTQNQVSNIWVDNYYLSTQ
jgi:hypothetical protein